MNTTIKFKTVGEERRLKNTKIAIFLSTILMFLCGIYQVQAFSIKKTIDSMFDFAVGKSQTKIIKMLFHRGDDSIMGILNKDPLLKTVQSTMMALSLALAIVFMAEQILKLYDKLESDASITYIVKAVGVLCITLVILLNITELIDKFEDLGFQVFDYILKAADKTNAADLEKLRESVYNPKDMTWNHPFKVMGALITLSAPFACGVISYIMLAMNCISLIIEMVLRKMLIPLSFSQVASDRGAEKGINQLKAYFACFIAAALIYVINYFSGVIVTWLMGASEKIFGNNILLKLVLIAAFEFSAIGVMSRTKALVQEHM